MKKTESAEDLKLSGWSGLWKKEDYWAIWLGFFIIAIGIFIYLLDPPKELNEKLQKYNLVLEEEQKRAPFRTIKWYEALDAKAGLRATGENYSKIIKRWTHKPHKWSENPIASFRLTADGARKKSEKKTETYLYLKNKSDDLKLHALKAEQDASKKAFKNDALNQSAVKFINEYREALRETKAAKKKTNVKPYNQVGYLVLLGLAIGIFFGIGWKFIQGEFWPFLKGFGLVFVLSVLAFFCASQIEARSLGIGYAAWAIALGLTIANTIGTPAWARPAIQVEYYIKTGLVLLGAEVLFGKVLSIGIPGIFVAWVVTPVVLLTTFWFGQKVLKITSKSLNITICADMSVCGVSAAIATAAACKAKKEELTLAIGLSLIFTSIMMVVMPNFIKAVGMDPILGGAWMGGTIDATGAVAAAGAFLGDKALYVAATIKMIQNILIGVVAFCVALYWALKVERDSNGGKKPSAMEIWYRFPKFVIGFLIASVVLSLIYEILGHDFGEAVVTHGVIKGWTKIWRGWFFCLAFVSIGLSTDFRELKSYFKGGKPLVLYVCGQSLNLILTLGMAYLMFYLVFPEITAAI
jgi:uncharacterized integral membrane protein (TIGR00698 family)